MNLRLVSLSIRDFCGVKSFDFAPNGACRTISGANGTGKSTTMRAILWLLTGKDAEGRTAFKVKPILENSESAPGVEPTVSAVFSVDSGDGAPYTLELKRVLHENWQKKRGTSESVYTGDETKLFWGGVPVPAKEWQANLNEICPEQYLPILLNPKYFSEQTTDYKARRALLFELFGGVTTADVLAADKTLSPLQDELRVASPDALVAKYKSLAKTAAEAMKALPVRMDEASKAVVPVDAESAEKAVSAANAEIQRLEQALRKGTDNPSAENARRAVRAAQSAHETALTKKDALTRALCKAANDSLYARRARAEKTMQQTSRAASVASNAAQMARDSLHDAVSERDALRTRWTSVNANEFDENALFCPTCGQIYPENQRDEMRARFNAEKAETLKQIQQEGKAVAARAENDKVYLAAAEKALAEAQSKADDASAAYTAAMNEPVSSLTLEQTALADREIAQTKAALDDANTALQAVLDESADDSASIQAALSAQRKIVLEQSAVLNQNAANAAAKARVESLSAQLQEARKAADDADAKLLLLERYNKTLVDAVTQSIDKNFSLVRWQLFEPQKNGGFRDVCTATADGVPYASQNTAMQVNMSLDIIAAFRRKLGVSLPVFVDNRESVTRLSAPDDMQIISLCVNPACKTLTVSEEIEAEAHTNESEEK